MFWRGENRRDFEHAMAPWRRYAFTLAALLAIFLQAFVIQTHIHTPVIAVAASTSGTTPAAAHERVASASDHQRVCVICQILSKSGSAPLPGAAVVYVAELTSVAAGVALALAPRLHTHSWRSRAPPSIL